MSGGHHIRAVGASGGDSTITTEAGVPGSGSDGPVDDALLLEESWDADWDVEPVRRDFGWLVPAGLLGLIAAWSAFFLWASFGGGQLPPTPTGAVELVGRWALPVLVVIGIWLLVQRNSTAAARRYAEAAAALSTESRRLEQRLVTVNRELSLAREFLASQGLELESLGRIASERLSEHADRLQSLVRGNSAQVEQIAAVSVTAMENMDKLRSDLPVIANSARDVANQIGSAGGVAEGQIERLVSGFGRLNEFGAASERQVTALSDQVAATLAAFDAQAAKMEEITAGRFALLRERSEEFRGELDSREVESLAALRRRAEQLAQELGETRGALDEQEEEALKSMRARLSALRNESETIARAIREGEDEAKALWLAQIDGMRQRLGEAVEQIRTIDDQAIANAGRKLQVLNEEATRVAASIADRSQQFQSELDERRARFAADEEQSLEALRQQLAAIDAELDNRRAEQIAQARSLGDATQEVSRQVGELTGQIESLLAESRTAQQGLLDTTLAMAKDLATSRADIAASQGVVAEMTEACVRLLELIQASVQHSKTDLPAAIGAAEQRLDAARRSTESLGLMLAEGVGQSEAISGYVIAANESGETLQRRNGELLQQLRALGEEYGAGIDSLRQALGTLEEDGQRVSAASQENLRAAIAVLEGKVRDALALAEQESSGTIERIADGIGVRAAESIDRAVRESSTGAMAELDAATARSTGAAREAAIQLRDQLALVNELAGNLENRVQRARERAQEQVDNDFARRVALITEALNSNAIDIAKSLSTDVTDTAWASYLRGDRGIFTRRAVSLLSNTEAREIAELYDADTDFRDHVSRYIHDFEAMLRTMLSTRDGNAIGVTLLSSDMGKLYVALAQAIERLRTE
ncbi:ATPase [Parerythrobacter aurantius]|uniref:ATPase n=1 Tax=Parerythrobacter aurantius TaxID=3127706 RepID=UPI00324436BC